jgi:hypothetical protein
MLIGVSWIVELRFCAVTTISSSPPPELSEVAAESALALPAEKIASKVVMAVLATKSIHRERIVSSPKSFLTPLHRRR